jgi:hypothetical protein
MYNETDPTWNLKVMGVTEAAQIKISNRLGSSAKLPVFQIADSSSLWGPLDDLRSKNAGAMTSIDFEGGLSKPWLPNFEIEKYFFSPWIRQNFFQGQKIEILPR